MQPQTFIFFGKSGSGKGTQAELLIKAFEEKGEKTLYIETGQRFREFVAREDNFTSRTTKEVMATGGLLPEFLPIWLWGGFLVENLTGDEHLVLDGLCRRADEAPVLDSALKFYKRNKPTAIYVNVSDNWALDRLRARGRGDDSEEYLKTRLNWFEWNVKPAMVFFHKHPDYNFLEINGEQSIEDVHSELLAKIKDLG